MLVTGAVACAFPAAPLFAVIGALHRICTWMNDAGAFASGYFAAPQRNAMIAGYLAALIALAAARGRRRTMAMAVALLIPIASALTPRDPVRAFRITMLDVGQGDAILLRDRAHAMLVDGGLDPERLLPLLADRGVRSLDALVLTHAHPDHCGALPAVLANLDVRELWISPRRFRGDCAHELLAARPNIRILRDGYRTSIGSMAVEVFLPDRTFRRSPENNASAALRVTAEMRTILLTGDLESDGESDLADRRPRADILKVAHHGSRTSTTRPLLDAVQPRVALISCGRRNLFGHPHPRVLEALRARRIRVWRTDTGGTIDVDVERGRIGVAREIDTVP
jgi:competence protein ComEC